VVVDLRLDPGVALPGIADDERAGFDVALDEVVEGLAAIVADDLHSQSAQGLLAPLDRDDDLDRLAPLRTGAPNRRLGLTLTPDR
jgi:hypothetical protein